MVKMVDFGISFDFFWLFFFGEDGNNGEGVMVFALKGCLPTNKWVWGER